MTKTAKLVAYAVFIITALWCGFGFSKKFNQVTTRSGDSNPIPATATLNQGGDSNLVAATPPSTNQAVSSAASPKDPRKFRMMAYGAGLIFAILGLGLLVAHDVTHYLARQVEQFVWEDRGEEFRSPEYEDAEKVWANGQHLEAIQLMREYLHEHPREQYVAIRIAEIYENDLSNYVAAALEYQEILQKPLPPERWGWIAIHLSNLYSGKMNKVAEAEALLRRITGEFPTTAAAQKARERLGEAPVSAEAGSPESAPDSAPGGRQPPHNLPPGFRPKSG